MHDTIEDTAYRYEDISREFPEAADLVLALTKIKDSRVLTYQKLFRYVLQDIRVLLIKLADRLDNLESLTVFSREKQERIARESAEMYANISRRLCMTDLADRLTEKIGPILTPEAFQAFLKSREELREGWTRPIEELRGKLATLFPGDLEARVEIHWNRFRPDVPALPENLFTVRIITPTGEDAYRALGRIHMAFRAVPGGFIDTMSTPRKNGYRALETHVSYQGRIVSFYVTNQASDRFNRLGLLSMDISSPQFNLEYLEDLGDFLRNEDMDIQDLLPFHKPDTIQVSSPKGDVFSLEEGATALDYAFAVHESLGLRAVAARVNNEEVGLDRKLRPGDRVKIIAAPEPVADDRYLSWAHNRKALAALRRHRKRFEAERASATGRQWLEHAGRAQGLEPEQVADLVRAHAAAERVTSDEIYRRVCLGDEEIAAVLEPKNAAENTGFRVPGGGLLRRFRPRPDARRKVRRYDFDDPHIRFCPRCVPLEGDEIEGVPEQGRLLVHQASCGGLEGRTALPLGWEKGERGDFRDPGAVELELVVEDGPGVLYALLTPFKSMGIDIRSLKLPQDSPKISLVFLPGTDRVLIRTMRALRKYEFVQEIRVFRSMG
jgi:(p)ppGpp synthase/HD superfamily hydrolase